MKIMATWPRVSLPTFHLKANAIPKSRLGET